MDFFNLTKDQVMRGLDIMHDSSVRQDAFETGDDLYAFAVNKRLQKLAFLWCECSMDMVLTKLRWVE